MYFYAGSKIKFYHSPHFAITTLLPRPIRSGATPLRAALARPRRKRTREAYYRFTGVLFECNFASRGAPLNKYFIALVQKIQILQLIFKNFKNTKIHKQYFVSQVRKIIPFHTQTSKKEDK